MENKFRYSEIWLTGPIEGIPALLQPAAHALLQAKDEIHETMEGFPGSLLWERPAGVASVGFHLIHIAGVLDRTFTYAQGKILSQQQQDYLLAESQSQEDKDISGLLLSLDKQIDKSLAYLKTVDPDTLTEPRTVGRKQLPSTVIGLLFHGAEHTMRHTGQLLATTRILKG